METFSEPAVLASPPPRIVRGVPAALPTQALTISGNRRHTRQGSQPNNGFPGGKALARISAPPVLEDERRKKPNSPLQWTVNEVVEWLKSKGFEPAVYDKFVEQDITGDVLLELDLNLLKAEIGISAFGKRMRISNAIAELRQPPSGSIVDPQPQHAQSIPHSASQPSYPYSPTWSTHQSPNSPSFPGTGLAPNPSTSLSPGVIESPNSETFASPHLTKRLSGFSSTGGSVNGYVPTERINDTAGVEKAGLVAVAGRDRTVPPETQLEPAASERALTVLKETEDDAQSTQKEGAVVPLAVRHGNRHFYDRPVEPATWGNENAEGSESPGRTPSPAKIFPLPLLLTKQHELEEDAISNLTTKKSLFSGKSMTSIGRLKKSPKATSMSMDEMNSTDKISSFGLSLSRLYSTKKAPRCPSTSDASSVSSIENGVWLGHQRNSGKREIKKAKSLDMLSDKKTTPKPKPTRLDENNHREPTLVLEDVNEDLCGPNMLRPGKSVIEQIRQPDYQGWMRKKGDRYNSWKVRYFIIKGPHLYILRSDDKAETRVKEYVNIAGYKVVADKNIDPGRYGFRIVHETDKTHSFSSEVQAVAHEWMKAITKPTIARDYSVPVMSSVDVPTVPLSVAQAMNPPPRPPSPLALAATQRAWRREHPSRLSPRDARVLMGLPSTENVNRLDDKQETPRKRVESFPTRPTVMDERDSKNGDIAPHLPVRRTTRRRPRRLHTHGIDNDLVPWANARLPGSLQVRNSTGPLFSGLALLRLAEDVMGIPAFPPVPDSVFPSGPDDDNLDGLFYLFDFLHDNDVKTGTVSINDVRHGKRDKVLHILKALKAREDKQKQIILSPPSNNSERPYRIH